MEFILFSFFLSRSVASSAHGSNSTLQLVSNDKRFRNVKIMEFGDYICNHHEKCIQISTNMPGIGLVICEIVENFENQNDFCMAGETNSFVQSINDMI